MTCLVLGVGDERGAVPPTVLHQNDFKAAVFKGKIVA